MGLVRSIEVEGEYFIFGALQSIDIMGVKTKVERKSEQGNGHKCFP
jgi:hypothetical protein